VSECSLDFSMSVVRFCWSLVFLSSFLMVMLMGYSERSVVQSCSRF